MGSLLIFLVNTVETRMKDLNSTCCICLLNIPNRWCKCKMFWVREDLLWKALQTNNIYIHPHMETLIEDLQAWSTKDNSLYINIFFHSFNCRRGNSPTLQRSPSPRRRYPPHLHHDIGFSDTVSNVVEIVKHEHQKAQSHRRYPRGWYYIPYNYFWWFC